MKTKILTLGIFITVLLLFASFSYAHEQNNVISVSTSDEIYAALGNAQSGDVIRLTNDITALFAYSIENRTITFDLNGYVLHLYTDIENMAALWVSQDGKVLTTGEGEFNITSVNGSALVVGENGTAMVNNLSGYQEAVWAAGNAIVNINGDAIGVRWGVFADDDAQVTVNGNVFGGTISAVRADDNATVQIIGNIPHSGATSISASGKNATVTVYGDVHGNHGMNASGGAAVTIYGNLTASAFWGIMASNHSVVRVYGNITCDNIAIIATSNSEVFVGGDVLQGGIEVWIRSTVTVEGNVNADIVVEDGAVVYIGGNVNGAIEARRGRSTVTVLGDVLSTEDTGVRVIIPDTTLTIRANSITGRLVGVDIYRARANIYADIFGDFTGVSARDEATVNITGNVTGRYLDGIYVSGDGSITTLTRDIFRRCSEVTVTGDIFGYRSGITIGRDSVAITVYGNISTATEGRHIELEDRTFHINMLDAWMDAPDPNESSAIRNQLRDINQLYNTIQQALDASPPIMSRTVDEYDEKYNGYRVFNISQSVIRVQPNVAPSELILFLNSYEILNTADNTVLQTMDVRPIVQNGHALLPLRFLADVLSADVMWDDISREITIVFDTAELTFVIDATMQLINGRTFVPLSFIKEVFNANAYFDSQLERIVLTL